MKTMLTIDEIAAAFRCSREYARAWARGDHPKLPDLRAVKMGRSWLFDPDHVAAVQQQMTGGPDGPDPESHT